MASIDFKLGDLDQLDLINQPFTLLINNYLQPNSNESLDLTTERILDQFTQGSPRAIDSIWRFSDEIMNFAEFVPPDHPAHSKLLDLLVSIYSSDRFRELPDKDKNDQLWMELRSHLDPVMTALDDSPLGQNAPTLEDLQYRNYNAFAANLYRLLSGDREEIQNWALWQMEIAHEGGTQRFFNNIRDGYLMAAAEWILIEGESMFRFFREGNRSVLRYTGPLWHEHAEELEDDGVDQSELPMRRWQFWRERFQAVAKGERDEEFKFAEETKTLCTKAVEKMQSLETGPE